MIMNSSSSIKRMAELFVAIVICIIFLYAIKSCGCGHSNRSPVANTASSSAYVDTRTPTRKIIDNQFDWDGSHIKLVKYVKRSMHNPNSFEHVETCFHLDGDFLMIGMSFRGTNGFGAIVTQNIFVKASKTSGDILEVLLYY